MPRSNLFSIQFFLPSSPRKRLFLIISFSFYHLAPQTNKETAPRAFQSRWHNSYPTFWSVFLDTLPSSLAKRVSSSPSSGSGFLRGSLCSAELDRAPGPKTEPEACGCHPQGAAGRAVRAVPCPGCATSPLPSFPILSVHFPAAGPPSALLFPHRLCGRA